MNRCIYADTNKVETSDDAKCVSLTEDQSGLNDHKSAYVAIVYHRPVLKDAHIYKSVSLSMCVQFREAKHTHTHTY